MYPRLALAVLVTALSACAAQPKPLPDADSIVVETPRYRVGDEWRFAGAGYRSRIHIVEVTGDTVVSERQVPARIGGCPGCRVVRDRNLTVLRVLSPGGRPRGDIGEGLRYLDFPLRVGKSWEHTLDMPSAGGPTARYANRFTVEAYELVTVPAGTFKAFRIRHDQENLTVGRRFTGTSWWSPDVRWFVRINTMREYGMGPGEVGGRDLELESYTLKP